MDKQAKIYVAGHRGLVGSAIVRELNRWGYMNLVVRTHEVLDLENQQAVAEFFAEEKPEYVILSAAKVGGIGANAERPAEFIYKNLMIEANIIHQSYLHNVKKLLFLGSSCIYPRLAQQPIKEESLLTGALEPTNEAYAVAKIAGIKLCESYNKQYGTKFISVMPTNLYGINDNFDLQSSHVLPALLRKIHEAKINRSETVTVWGSGTPIREFLFVDDLANACIYLMNHYDGNKIVNIGTGIGITIKELAELVKTVVGYQGSLVFDASKPDGTPKKINDIGFLSELGWQAQVALEEGLRRTYAWYKEQI